MKKKFVFVGLCLFLAASQVFGQISRGGTPAGISISELLPQNIYAPKVIVFTNASTLPAERRDTLVNGGKMHIIKASPIGVLAASNIGFDNGTITELSNGTRIWRLQVSIPDARALGLYYDRFYLPQGVKYFEYNANKKQVLGAYTNDNNPSGGPWATEKVQGDVINLEMDIDAGVNINDISFHINRVASFFNAIGYLDAYSDTKTARKASGTYVASGGSSTCEVNAVCPIGTGYDEDRKATIAIEYLNGLYVYMATGTLVNNTRQDCTPYLLTATHVEATGSTADSTFAQWIFYFNYEAPTCSFTGTAPTPQTMTGATFKARAAYTAKTDNIVGDFLLLQLKHAIPSSYGAYLAGWDLDTATTSGSFIGFHHPAGDLKKVSLTSIIDPSGSYTGTVANTHWLLQWDQGGVEEGSSGSGLFNAKGRLIGIASAGAALNASCFDKDVFGDTMANYALYSKMSFDWSYAYQTPSTSTSRLKDWLDPDNTGATSLDAKPADCGSTSVVAYHDISQNDIVMYPNPTNGIAYASVNFSRPTDLQIEVYNIVGGKLFSQHISNATAGKYKIDLNQYANGTYIISFIAGDVHIVKKVLLDK